MATTEQNGDPMEVQAENIGGIDTATVTLEPGVNVLVGRNASNRTSFLQAIMAAVGSEQSTLKGDADEGRVELAVGDETYDRVLRRRNDQVIFDGETYLDDPTVADLFAFLLGSNETRRVARQGGDLRDLIMRPIDTTEIRQSIEALEEEKREIDETLANLDRFEEEVGDLERRRAELESTIERRESELEETKANLADLDADLSTSQEKQAEIESAFSQLHQARKELEAIEFDLQTERETRDELRAEREEIRDELADQEDIDAESAEVLAGRIDELRERKNALDGTISELQNVIRFNEEHLEDGGIALAEAVGESQADGAVTDALVADESEIVCWTCGSEVSGDRVEQTLDRLRTLHQEKLDERTSLTDQIAELTDRQDEIRERERERERLQDRLEEIDATLEEQTARIDDLETRRDEQRAQIEEYETETEAIESNEADYGEVIETHREISQIEIEIENHEDELADIETRIEDLDSRLAERDELEARRAALTDELTDLRTRVDRIEAQAVDAFNEHMESILSILGYSNIDRIWIERRETEVSEGRRTVSQSVFDLHVVRRGADGASYEDTIDHLSESEREVTSIVFALAGYLVHDVYETVPVMLLDSLEAIDSERIATLVEYFAEYAEYIVVALLPEDAQALSEDYRYVHEI